MSDGSLIFRTSPRDAGIDIFMASGQVDPAVRIFAADGSLLEGFPLGGGLATLPINLAGGPGVVTGVLPAANVDMSGNVVLAPGTVSRNTIQPTSDNNHALILKGHSNTQNADLFQVQDNTGTVVVSINEQAGPQLLTLSPVVHNAIPLSALGTPGGGNGVGLFQGRDNSGNILGSLSIDDGGGLFWAKQDSGLTTTAPVASIQPEFSVNTHGSSRGRLRLTCQDSSFNFREFLRGEAGASVPLIGFLGATAVARPSSTDDLRQSLINLGLYTTGGASPLNLNGGMLTCATIQEALTDAATSISTSMQFLTHHSSLTPVVGFGTAIEFSGDDNANVVRRMARLRTQWNVATSGSTSSQIELWAANSASFVPCLYADGTQLVTIPGSFFHSAAGGKIGLFGITPVVQQANASQAAITAVIDPNAQSALQAIYNLLKNYGAAPATA